MATEPPGPCCRPVQIERHVQPPRVGSVPVVMTTSNIVRVVCAAAIGLSIAGCDAPEDATPSSHKAFIGQAPCLVDYGECLDALEDSALCSGDLAECVLESEGLEDGGSERPPISDAAPGLSASQAAVSPATNTVCEFPPPNDAGLGQGPIFAYYTLEQCRDLATQCGDKHAFFYDFYWGYYGPRTTCFWVDTEWASVFPPI